MLKTQGQMINQTKKKNSNSFKSVFIRLLYCCFEALDSQQIARMHPYAQEGEMKNMRETQKDSVQQQTVC